MHLIIGLANIHSLSAYGAMMLECFATILIDSQKLLNFKIIFTIVTIIKQINSINLSKTEPFDSPVEATEKSTIGSLLARVEASGSEGTSDRRGNKSYRIFDYGNGATHTEEPVFCSGNGVMHRETGRGGWF